MDNVGVSGESMMERGEQCRFVYSRSRGAHKKGESCKEIVFYGRIYCATHEESSRKFKRRQEEPGMRERDKETMRRRREDPNIRENEKRKRRENPNIREKEKETKRKRR